MTTYYWRRKTEKSIQTQQEKIFLYLKIPNRQYCTNKLWYEYFQPNFRRHFSKCATFKITLIVKMFFWKIATNYICIKKLICLFIRSINAIYLYIL